MLILSFIAGGCVGFTAAMLYLDLMDEHERYRYGDYTFKRYEDGKVTCVVPMTAEQRAACEKVFEDADKMFDNIGK